jgi:iron(III) transport system ATP-binding protein
MIAEFMGDAIVLPARLGGGFADCALGHIPVHECDRHGAAHTMLRPEQVTFVPVPKQSPQNASASTGYLAEVIEIGFGGSVCSVGVRLLNAATEIDRNSPPLRLLASSIQTPQPGAIVRISVIGAAHVFPLADHS